MIKRHLMARHRTVRRLRGRVAAVLAAVTLLSGGLAFLLGASPAYGGTGQPPTVTPPASPSNNLNPTWTVTSPATPVECELLDPSGTAVYGWATCGNTTAPFTVSYSLVGDADGTYTFYAASGGMTGTPPVPASNDTSSAYPYTLDTTPPAPPTITSSFASPGNATSPQWGFTLASGAVSATCKVTNSAGATVIAATTCTSPYTANLSGQPDDTYTFAVTDTDAAGNVSTPATSTYQLLTTPPAAPTITTPPASPSNSTSPQWGFTTPTGTTDTCKVTNSAGTTVIAAAPCTSPYTANLSGQPNDTYTFSVTAKDAAGNVSSPATSTYQLSIVAVAAPTITSTPSSPSKSTSPQWAFTLPSGTTATCKVTNSAGTTVIAAAPCTSPYTANLAGQPNDTYTFSVTATDVAGNVSSPATSTYQLSIVAVPPPTITSAPTSPSNSTSPQWAFTAPPATVTTTCKVTNSAGATVIAAAPCTSPYTANLAGQPNDTYTFSVTATDGAGNVSPPATSTYQLSIVAVPAPTITSSPSSPGNSTSPQWGFTLPSGTTGTCQVTNSTGKTVIAAAACTSPFTASLAGQPDDTYTFSVTATDAAGNVSSPATSTYQLLTTPPAAPTITTSPASPGNTTSPKWAFTTPAVTTDTCQVTNSAAKVIVAQTACSATFTANLSGQPDDTYTLTIVATDAAGNSSLPATSNYQLLTTAPSAPTITSAPASPGQSTSPQWGFTLPSGTTGTCQVTNSTGKTVIAAAACTSPFTASLAGQPDDTYTFSVTATDAAGNVSSPATSTYQLLTTPPAAPTITTSPASPGNTTSPKWAFTTPAGTTDTCQVTNSAAKVIVAQTACSATFTANLSGQPDDTYTLTIVATDAAGNSSLPATSNYQLLTTAPSAPTITSAPSSGSSTSLAWTFTTPPGTTSKCQLTGPGGVVLSAWAACASPTSFPVPGTPGTYTLSVVATDAAGNVSSPAIATFSIAPPPVVAPTTTAPPAATSPTTTPPTTTPPTTTPPTTAPVKAPPPTAAPSTPPATSPQPVASPTTVAPAPQPTPPATVAAVPVTTLPAPPAQVSTPPVATTVAAAPVAPAPVPAPTGVVPPPVRPAPGPSHIVELVRRAAMAISEGTGVTFLLWLVLVAFLAVQDRIDRNDPKLALAPVYAEPDLPFLAPPRPGDEYL